MTQLIMPPDVILWATGWLRAKLATQPEAVTRGVEVSHREPSVPQRDFPRRLIVLREAGTADTDAHLSDFTLQAVTLAGTPESPHECVVLSRIVHALFRGCAGLEPGNPVVSVDGSRGPLYAGEEQPRARRMSYFDLTIANDVVDR